MNRFWMRFAQQTRMGAIICGCLALWSCPPAATAEDIFIDGHFEDWSQPARRVDDPAGDAKAAFDLSFVEVSTLETQLFLHFDIGQPLNLQSGKRSEGTLQLKLKLNDGRSVTIDFRERFACLDDQPDERLVWTSLRMVSQPTYAAKEIEMRLDLASLGAKTGDTIAIQFAGSDELDQPITVRLEGEAKRLDRSIRRVEASDLRVVSMNTMNQGVADESRQPKFRRLFTAVDADVICFQEERDEGRFADSVAQVLPQLDEGEWSSHWANGAAIASRHKVQGLPVEMTAGAAAAITTPNDQTWLVFSVHLKCCGYAGSPEDKLRVTQAEEIVEQWKRIQAGEFGDELVGAPTIVVGDFNLVGSRQPLEVLTNAGLNERLVIGIHDASTATWRGRPDESFWPGRLDLVTYDREQAEAKHSYSLDTSLMAEFELEQTKLHADDSSVSDHLMMVADFAKRVKE